MLYDLIIVGGGIAGLTAAIYARRGGLNTLLLEGGAPGGQIIASPELENYPALPKVSGVAFVQRLLEQTAALELEIKYETVSKLHLTEEIKEVETASGAKYQARTIIWAAGLVARRLDCPGSRHPWPRRKHRQRLPRRRNHPSRLQNRASRQRAESILTQPGWRS